MSQATLKQCGPCTLYQQYSNHYFHPQNWESEMRTRLWKHDYTYQDQLSSVIIKHPFYQWMVQKCSVTGCNNEADVNLNQLRALI